MSLGFYIDHKFCTIWNWDDDLATQCKLYSFKVPLTVQNPLKIRLIFYKTQLKWSCYLFMWNYCWHCLIDCAYLGKKKRGRADSKDGFNWDIWKLTCRNLAVSTVRIQRQKTDHIFQRNHTKCSVWMAGPENLTWKKYPREIFLKTLLQNKIKQNKTILLQNMCPEIYFLERKLSMTETLPLCHV